MKPDDGFNRRLATLRAKTTITEGAKVVARAALASIRTEQAKETPDSGEIAVQTTNIVKALKPFGYTRVEIDQYLQGEQMENLLR